MTFIDMINDALVGYLERVYNIRAVRAELDEIIVNNACSCCIDNELAFAIRYKLAADAPAWRYQEVGGDVIDFLYSLQSYSED